MDVSMCQTLNQSEVRTEVHDMIAADRAIVNDDICGGFVLSQHLLEEDDEKPTPCPQCYRIPLSAGHWG